MPTLLTRVFQKRGLKNSEPAHFEKAGAVKSLRADAAFAERVRLSHGVDYVLRLTRIYTEMMQGDVVSALVFLAAARAGTQHLTREIPFDNRGFVEDKFRRPVSISGLARSLGLSTETVRRHVLKLADAGFVSRTDAGWVLVKRANLERDEVQKAVRANITNLERLTKALGDTPRVVK